MEETTTNLGIDFPITKTLAGLNFSALFGVVALILLLAYILFAFFIIKQVYSMDKTLYTSASFYIKLVAWFHFCLAVFAFVSSFSFF